MILALFGISLASATAHQAQAIALPGGLDPENTLILTLKDGPVVIKLRPDLAPKTVARIKELSRQKFYDGIVFHRVIEGFMAQTGDPRGTGTGGSGVNVPAEFSDTPFLRGTVGMARSASPNSGDSQFFICFGPADSLNGQYTVFGQVVSGMNNVDLIKKGMKQLNGQVTQPDMMISLRVAADVK
ncbi:MAG: peptidylprolyl isomerase [Alphaproteobacteria bacterium]|nr:peptidylprolyl isomerase [Alphaproteobacteria bacterium]